MALKTKLTIRCANQDDIVQCMETGNTYNVEYVFEDGSAVVGSRFDIMSCSVDLIILEPYNYWVVEEAN